ncbi:major facilitator superfamily domain-containing protein [Mycena alexandri]|uniref:Major facilitator superfamily domain-containing protein n=1 Tax=Mycena alexandri TaxID=1745969 RepID=A0AAD6TFX5_9AGAR|nr:major facilitator superfamily domain-containing protein [Mycena alexandri]
MGSPDKKRDASFEESRSVGPVGALVIPPSLVALSPNELARIGRKATLKIDLLVMPALIIMYILNFLDRQNIAAAKLAALTTDLKLTAVQYQSCISLLFVGYILVGKISRPATYICAAVALWGVISAATGAVQSFTGLLLCRFFLGFVEAIFFPGALYYLSMFYNRKQYTFRVALLYSGSQLGNAFGGLLAVGILKANGAHGIEGWRWLFIVEGAATVGIAFLLMFVLPNSVATVTGLSAIECDWLARNFESDQGQRDDKDELSGWQAFKMAATDPKTYLLMGTLHMTYVAAAVTSFFPSVVSTLGYSRNITYVLTAPPSVSLIFMACGKLTPGSRYLLCVVIMIASSIHSDRTQERYWHIVVPLVFTTIANIIAISTLNTAARYVSMMLMPGSFYGATVVILSWVSGSLTQPAVKRAAGIAFINAVSNTPNIWTPYLYTNPPRYVDAFSVNLAASVLAILFATATMVYLKRQNARLDRGLDLRASAPTEQQQAAGFRYII